MDFCSTDTITMCVSRSLGNHLLVLCHKSSQTETAKGEFSIANHHRSEFAKLYGVGDWLRITFLGNKDIDFEETRFGDTFAWS